MEKRIVERRNMYDEAEKAVRSRIKNVLREKGLTENSVAAGDGAAQSRLNSQLKDGRITLNTILHILEACPDVSADWLLRGMGQMIKAEMIFIGNTAGRGSRQTFGNTTTTSHYSGCVDEEKDNKNYVHELLAAKDAIIAEKEKRIMEKDEMIILLKKQK